MSIKSAASSAPSSASANSKMPPTQKPAKMSNGMPKPVCSSTTAALTSLCPPGPIPSRHNSVASQRGSWVADEISLGEIFRLIAQMKICVIRRAGSDIEGQITSIIDSAASGRAMANGTSSEDVPLANTAALAPVAHFLSVGQQSAGQMLDRVGRMGLPLIFLNGDCVGGLNELKLLEKSGFLGESLGTHKFDLVVVGGGGGGGDGGGDNEAAENAVEEAVLLGKRVAYVELAGKSSNGTSPAGTNSRLAKDAANQAALMRTAIEEARASGWTVEGEQGAKVSFWLDWPTVREGILCRAEARRQRMDATFRLGKVECFRALACQFSGFHELTLCPDLPTDSEQFKEEGLMKLSADRFLLAIGSEPKTLENVPGARECAIYNSQLFSTPNNPGKTLFCCENASDPAILESASILRALGNDLTVMCCSLSNAKADKPSSFDVELVEHIKERLASEKGVRFVVCVPTKFEQLREPAEGRAGIVRVLAMSTAQEGNAEKLKSSNNNGNGGEWSPFLEEFNTVVLSLGHRSEPFQGLGLDKLSVLLAGVEGKSRANAQQKSSFTSVPNIYAFSDSPQGASNAWSSFGPRQLLRRMFQGELSSLVESDLCRTLLLPPLEYSCCGLTEREAQKRFGKEALSVYRDGQVPLEGVQKAKMICLKPEQERVIGLHILGPDASKQLQGYALAMQLGLSREKMETMRH